MADKIREVLQEDSKRCNVEAEYETPAGEKRFIAVTISPVPSVDGSLLGVACLINDMSELEQIRRQQQLHGEISAEMALQLRTSLATISSCAQQLGSNRDAETAQRLAEDIAHEAAESGPQHWRIFDAKLKPCRERPRLAAQIEFEGQARAADSRQGEIDAIVKEKVE